MRENPSAVRSKMMLTNALLTLMRTKPYEKISIKEITDTAQLARMTFYTNFKTKDDLLIYCWQSLLSEYKRNLAQYQTYDVAVIALEFFRVWQAHKTFVASLTHTSMSLVLQQAEAAMTGIVEEYQLTPTFKSTRFQQYEWTFLVGGLMNMTLHWIHDGCRESPEEMAYIFSSIGIAQEL